jgi:hypothetical protein
MDGLDPKRVKSFSPEAAPPAHGFIDNKFGGPNADQGEEYGVEMNLAPNVFPREKGSDSAGEFAGGDFAG